MKRAWIATSAMACALLSGCGPDVQSAQNAGSAAGSGAASSSGDAGGAGGSGAGGGAGGEPLSGHYMQQMIGNCINEEEWLSFSPPEGFTYTFVDRNYCAPHSVTATPGLQSNDGSVVEIVWNVEEGTETRRFTYARVDPYPGSPGVPLEPGYELGTAALNHTAYARAGTSLTWHREDFVDQNYGEYAWFQDMKIDLTFAAPLGTPMENTACSMTVTIAIQAEYDGVLSSGDESFVLPCTYGPDEVLPWIRVAADGFENPNDGDWSDYLGSLGVWSKYPASVQNAFGKFYPMFYYVPGDDSRLFQDHWQSWYLEMKTPPPDSVP